MLGCMLLLCSKVMTSVSRTQSNTCVRSIKHIKAVLLNSIAFSVIWQIINIASIVNLLFLHPCCSLKIPVDITSSAIILVNSFSTELNKLIPYYFCGSVFSPHQKMDGILQIVKLKSLKILHAINLQKKRLTHYRS